MLNQGYIKLYRSLLDWEWYQDVNVKVLFIHLLMSVNYESKKWRGILIERGQLVTSLSNLSLETKLSVKQIRTALKKLKSTGEVVTHSASGFTKIYIQNFDKYQEIGQTSVIKNVISEGTQEASEGQLRS